MTRRAPRSTRSDTRFPCTTRVRAVREGRIRGALAGSPVPVPAILAVGAPGDPLDVPCIVMDHLDGLVIADHERAALLDGSARRRAGASLVAGLVAIHAVHVTAVALGDRSRPEGYPASHVPLGRGRCGERRWQVVYLLESAKYMNKKT